MTAANVGDCVADLLKEYRRKYFYPPKKLYLTREMEDMFAVRGWFFNDNTLFFMDMFVIHDADRAGVEGDHTLYLDELFPELCAVSGEAEPAEPAEGSIL
jgi:hypothetical protein